MEPKEEKDEVKLDANQKGGEIILDRIRTYQDAVSDALKNQDVSGAKILMSEQRKRDQQKEEEDLTSIKSPKNKIFFLISIILIVLTIGIISFVFIKNKNTDSQNNNVPKQVLKSVFFESEGIIETATSQLSRNTILKIQQIFNSQFPKGSIQQIALTKEIKADPDSSLNLTKTVSYDTNDFLSLLEARINSIAKRSLDSDFFLGIHVLNNSNEPFVVFKINDFNNVYSGMFQWEKTLTTDFSPIFFKNLTLSNQSNAIIGANVSSSSVPVFDPRNFKDEVIGNTDARVIRNERGEMLYFYTFIDEEYLFFGTNNITFNEVRDRIRSAKLVL